METLVNQKKELEWRLVYSKPHKVGNWIKAK